MKNKKKTDKKKDKIEISIPTISLKTILWGLNLTLFGLDLCFRFIDEDPILSGILKTRKDDR